MSENFINSPWTSLAISNTILAFSSFFGVFLMVQCYRLAQQKMPQVSALLAYLLVGSAATLGTLRLGISPIFEQPYLMIITAAKVMAPPLLGAAIASVGWQQSWSRPTWWRLMLGLMAGYELSRQSGYTSEFLFTTALVSLAVMAAAILFGQRQERNLLLFGTIAVLSYGLAALAIGTEGTLAGYLRLDLYRYLIALGNLFSASGLFIYLKRTSRSTDASERSDTASEQHQNHG